MTLKIGVCGAAGRMGRTILALCHETEGVKVTAAIEHDKSPAAGRDAGELAGTGRLGVPVTNIAALGDNAADNVDVLIDFSLAAGVCGQYSAVRGHQYKNGHRHDRPRSGRS